MYFFRTRFPSSLIYGIHMYVKNILVRIPVIGLTGYAILEVDGKYVMVWTRHWKTH